MKITVNKDAKTNTVNELFNRCVKAIMFNADNGIDVTELFVPVDFAGDVRERLEKEIEGIDFLIVRRGVNPLTGRPCDYTGETINGERRYKVRIR